MKPSPASAWCPECQKHVVLVRLRPWPEGVLAVGECPDCHSKLAAKKPLEWSGLRAGGGTPAAVRSVELP